MVDAIVSVVLEQLISTTVEEAKERVRLVKGVDREVNSLREDFEAIRAVMVDAEERQWKEETVRLWLEKLKDASYDMEDVLDEWNTARLKLKIKDSQTKKVCSFFPAASCFGFKQIILRHDITVKIKEINERVNVISKKKDSFDFNVITSVEKSERIQSSAFDINVSEVCGRDEENNTLKGKLLCEGSVEQNAVQIISLVGMGGIGKTTLAQYAFHDIDVINHFHIKMWVCVSNPFDVIRVAKAIIEELRVAKAIIEELESFATNLGEFNSLLKCINTSISGKRFFLVLDDVWTEKYCEWEPFRNCLMNGLRGSKILVTTRNDKTVEMMQSTDFISIKVLSEQQCWSLFQRIAFFGRSHSESNYEQLQEIGRKIVERCKGLPLAAKTIGSLLQFKKSWEEWQIILNSELWEQKKFEEDVVSPLLLSYNDLPSKIKQCFSYCAVFPKDYNLEKDELIKLWIAQGYIEAKKSKDLEMIGQEYFNCLAARSFFQEFQSDEGGTIISCKMHDIVHDFAQLLTKNECSFMRIEGSQESISSFDHEKLRHLMLVLDNNASILVSIPNAKKLRSLLIDIWWTFNVGDRQRLFFDQMTCLRALRIISHLPFYQHQMMINALLKGIGKLIHLRYLQLDCKTMEELPETCCELLNLQTLDIQGCSLCRRLPQGIGKLVNLRHLIFHVMRFISPQEINREMLRSVNFCLEYMPKGIERLTSLRTLSEFVVVRRDGKYGSKACNLDGLKELNHLRGSLRIRGLENVTDVDEVKNAHLEKKENLVRLQLIFFDVYGYSERGTERMDQEEIIDALRPPPNLESLEIESYEGKTLFPNWILSLNKLKDLKINNCLFLEIMPPLGKLPSLELLEVWNMKRIKRVGDEFLGIAGSSGTSSSITAFPKLKTLELWHSNEWEEWDFGKEDITVMPQLNNLRINYCRKLKSIPDQLLQRTTMKTLEIVDCPILKERFRKTGDDWSKISHIPTIRIDYYYMRGGTHSLQENDGEESRGNDGYIGFKKGESNWFLLAHQRRMQFLIRAHYLRN